MNQGTEADADQDIRRDLFDCAHQLFFGKNDPVMSGQLHALRFDVGGIFDKVLDIPFHPHFFQQAAANHRNHQTQYHICDRDPCAKDAHQQHQ